MSLNVTFLMPTAFVADDLEHAVDQQHRVAVRQDPLDPPDVHCGPRRLSKLSREIGLVLLEQPPGEQVVQLVPALVRDEPPADRPADEVQVADQVEHLVPGALVGEAERVVDRAGRRDDQQFLGRQVLAQAAVAKLLASCSKTNVRAGASWLTKSSSPRRKRDRLPADRRAGFEVVDDFQVIGRPGQGGERRVAVRHLHRLPDDQRLRRRILLGDAGFAVTPRRTACCCRRRRELRPPCPRRLSPSRCRCPCR